ncbi:DUF4873 domain-containing protein [Nocardia sp. NPDC048505]|uniref:DUF4873 domain-containing protein n=1 Tax=unclassified Nocardia TaxID=2637762 RepID=UPI0033D80818
MAGPEIVVLDAAVAGEELCAASPAEVVLLRTAERLDFDAAEDRWEVLGPGGRRYRPRVVVLGQGARAAVPANGRALPGDQASYLGVAAHGFPNLFLHSGSGRAARHRARYIGACVRLLYRSSSTRMEVRAATQHEYLRRAAQSGSVAWRRRALRRPEPRHYELTVAADREPAHEYSGPAMLDAPGALLPVHVTLNGHADPIDGRYHWYGRIAGTELPDPGRAAVALTLPGGRPATGRLQERDPWGNLRIAGTGPPPF